MTIKHVITPNKEILYGLCMNKFLLSVNDFLANKTNVQYVILHSDVTYRFIYYIYYRPLTKIVQTDLFWRGSAAKKKSTVHTNHTSENPLYSTMFYRWSL